MKSNLEKFEEVTDEVRVIRDISEFKSNSPEDFKKLLESIIKLYEDVIRENDTLDSEDVIKANEMIDKLVRAQPELEDIKENLEKRSKIVSNLKYLEKEKDKLINIVDLNSFRNNNDKEFNSIIINVISYYSAVTSYVELGSDEYNKAQDYIKEICNKHPELKQFEELFFEKQLDSTSVENKTKEIENKFEKEKFNVRVNSLTEEIEKLRVSKSANQDELNKYRKLIEEYKKEILNNQKLSNEEKQELINKLDKDNQVISMLEILNQKEMKEGPSL